MIANTKNANILLSKGKFQNQITSDSEPVNNSEEAPLCIQEIKYRHCLIKGTFFTHHTNINTSSFTENLNIKYGYFSPLQKLIVAFESKDFSKLYLQDLHELLTQRFICTLTYQKLIKECNHVC